MQDNNRNLNKDLIGKISIHDGKVLYVYNDGSWSLPTVDTTSRNTHHYWRTPSGEWESVYWDNPSPIRSSILDKAYNDYIIHIMEKE